MKNYLYLIALLLLLFQISCSQSTVSNDNNKNSDTSRTINLSINYSGTGTVDANHQIYAAIFNISNPDTSSIPTNTLVTSTNNSTMKITGITYSPCYLMVVYDNDSSKSSKPTSTDRFEGYNNKGTTPLDPINISASGSLDIIVDFDNSFTMP
jgi:hypothetical protein